jgi:glycosyltransferase involved in cell wall biosynthesis
VANAGAETMLSRLARTSLEAVVIVSLIDISDRNRLLAGDCARFERLNMHSGVGAASGVFHLARLIAREKPAVILCWMYHAFLVGLLAQRLSLHSTPLFWNVRQSLDDPAALSRSTRAALHICKRLSHLPTGIIYNSSRSLELHRRLGFENGNVEVIPNGFDSVEERPRVRSTPHVFGMAARFHPQKDYETFFRAAALFLKRRPNVRFVAAGAGLSRDNAEVRNMMAAAGLPEAAIELRGQVDDMAAFYHDIDVLVLSSRTEGFPNVVAEAMSHGKPVVTADVGDAALVVGDTGVVVPPRNEQALAQGMCRMMDLGQDDYAALSLAVKQRIDDRFSLAQIVNRYSNFLARRDRSAHPGTSPSADPGQPEFGK